MAAPPPPLPRRARRPRAARYGSIDIVLNQLPRISRSHATPITRRVMCSFWCPCVVDADRCVQSDGVSKLELQEEHIISAAGIMGAITAAKKFAKVLKKDTKMMTVAEIEAGDPNDDEWEELDPRVRQRGHCVATISRVPLSSKPPRARAACHVIFRVYMRRMLIGAHHPMLCPIHVFRPSTPPSGLTARSRVSSARSSSADTRLTTEVAGPGSPLVFLARA